MKDYKQGRKDAVEYISENMMAASPRVHDILKEALDPKNIAGQARERNRELYEKTLKKV